METKQIIYVTSVINHLTPRSVK